MERKELLCPTSSTLGLAPASRAASLFRLTLPALGQHAGTSPAFQRRAPGYSQAPVVSECNRTQGVANGHHLGQCPAHRHAGGRRDHDKWDDVESAAGTPTAASAPNTASDRSASDPNDGSFSSSHQPSGRHGSINKVHPLPAAAAPDASSARADSGFAKLSQEVTTNTRPILLVFRSYFQSFLFRCVGAAGSSSGGDTPCPVLSCAVPARQARQAQVGYSW